MRTRVELFEAIRRDQRRDGLSIRALADRHGVHRRTVREALASAVPPERKAPVRVAPKMDPVKPLIDVMLRQDLDAPKKQRHTARRILARLIEEHGITDVGYSSVREYVCVARPRIWAEAGRGSALGFVPQTHEPGAQAEVDFADLWVDLAGVRTKLHLFTLRMSFSGKAVHRVFATQSQEAFLEGHVHAFDVLGGVPVEHIRYDNPPGGSRSARTTASTRSTANPVWRARTRRAVSRARAAGSAATTWSPSPRSPPWPNSTNASRPTTWPTTERRIAERVLNVAESFALEADLLHPLPFEAFETGLTLTPRVDRYSRVTVRQSHYSVPARFIGHRLRVVLRATELVVFEKNKVVARHERAVARGSQSLQLDHYLEILQRKPGALPGATALVQARGRGVFTATHEAFWAAARKAHGDAGGARALIGVLLLHRHTPAEHVLAGITAALGVGATDPEVVAVEARKAARPTTAGTDPSVVVDLAARRLPADARPAPDLNPYDDLLTGTDQT